MAYKQKASPVSISYGGESNKQEKSNLINDNPVLGKMIKGTGASMMGAPSPSKPKKERDINKPISFDGSSQTLVKKSKKVEKKSDQEIVKSNQKTKIDAGKAKKAEGQSDLKKARESKFVSRGDNAEGTDAVSRTQRRRGIRAARKKKREGRRAERKARKGTVIKQKSVRQRKKDD